MDIIKQAEAFELKPLTFKNTSERIEASREVKSLILSVNEIYKTNNDPVSYTHLTLPTSDLV